MKHTTQTFSTATIMPNVPLVHREIGANPIPPPIMTAKDVLWYRGHLIERGMSQDYDALMTIALCDETTPQMIEEAAPHIHAAKLYPRGATTNSGWGVTDYRSGRLRECFKVMAELNILLLVHAENPISPILDREWRFIGVLDSWLGQHPGLRVVVEHVSDHRMARFVRMAGENVAATITAHHLELTLDDVLGSRIHPHNFCLPVAKTHHDRDVLRDIAVSGHHRFFFGSDSAPHPISSKQCTSISAGCFSAPVALPLLAQLFAGAGELRHLEAFTSINGRLFYGHARSADNDTITLARKAWRVPSSMYLRDLTVVPFMAGQTLQWSVEL